MKHLVLLASILALSFVVAAPAMSQAKGGTVGCCYTALEGPTGMLEISAPRGTPYAAWNSEGAMVASGMMSESMASMPVWTSGPDPQGIVLYVHVGGAQFALGIDDNGWVFE